MFNIQRGMWLFICMGVVGCVHAGTTPTLNKQTATTQTATTQTATTQAFPTQPATTQAITTQTATTQSVSTVQSTTSGLADLSDNRARSTTTINNKSNVDSLTAGNIKNDVVNKSPITTTMIAAVADDKVVNGNSGNMSSEVTKESNATISNAVKNTLVQSKGTTTESSIDKSVNVVDASINTGGIATLNPKSANDSVNGSLDIVVDSSLEGSVKVISDNKIKPDIHINYASTSIPPITDGDRLVIVPAGFNNDIPKENAIVKLHVAGDIPFGSKNTKEPRTDIKNRDNVPTRDELIAIGADNVDFVQHRVEYPIDTNRSIDSVDKQANLKDSVAETSNTNEVARTGIKNSANVPTRDELIGMGADNVDFVQHRVESPFNANRRIGKQGNVDSVDKQASLKDSVANTNEVPRTDIKNRDNVPTRDELIAIGADNVDLVQHRVEYPINTNRSIEKIGNVDSLDKQTPLKDSVAETKQTINTNEVPRTGIKNRDNVPTRDELIAMGANNVDFVQHRVESPFNANRRIGKQGNVDSVDKQASLKDSVANTNEVPRTDIKNRDNVPTRDELIAIGADNVDLVQHRVEYPINTNRSIEKIGNVDSLDKQAPLKDSVAETKQTINTNEVPRTDIKNRDNVPTRDELLAMGADNVDLVQHRVEDTIDLSWLVKNKEVNANDVERQNVPTESSNKTQTDINSKTERGVKNKNNVPTRDELLAKGETNVDFVQHRVVDNFQPKRVVNNPISADENPNNLNGDVSKRQTSTNMPGTVMKSEKVNVIGQPLMKGMDTNIAESKPATDNKTGTTTTENQPETNKQIPMPKGATQTSLTSSNKQTTNGQAGSTGNIVNSLVLDTKNNGVTSEVTTHVLTTKKNGMTKTVCPKKKCAIICKFGYKEDANGCSTCDCQYSNSCPRAIPISRLLCLLQVGIRASPNCAKDADCRRNRICCPGTCGTICRRESRNRSMLLSMLID